MARTPGTEQILDAAARWRERCLLANGSMFSDDALWTRENVAELVEHFIEKPDEGSRPFLEKLHDQLRAASPAARRLAAEMLWVMLLFPSNVSIKKKVANVRTIWGWAGAPLDERHPMLAAFGSGIGSGGMGYNAFRPAELQFFIRLMEDWKALTQEERERRASDAWRFAEWVDTVEGAETRQFRHMILHLLFPEEFERVSSGANKAAIDAAYAAEAQADSPPLAEQAASLIARDRRLLRIRRVLEERHDGARVDFYEGDFLKRWQPDGGASSGPGGDADRGTARSVAVQPHTGGEGRGEESEDATESGAYSEPTLHEIVEALQSRGLSISERTVRRYHLALKSRGFVILSGISGTGKTWLAEAYAHAVGAVQRVVPVAPNWTMNEDLLGFFDPLSSTYRDTVFSRFLREAAAEHHASRRDGRPARPYHLILDEMNLARVEHYFAQFLSGMEIRMRGGEALIELGPKESVSLPPNLRFVGTVNVDETTHGFADKVYDRAQVIEIPAPREAIEQHLAGAVYRDSVLAIWDAVRDVAPFAFRVLDDFRKYCESAAPLGVAWGELVDELLLQKVLPKIKGTDPRVGEALDALEALTAEQFPLSHEKVSRMLADFRQHGLASYF
jgi:hypothetical protein